MKKFLISALIIALSITLFTSQLMVLADSEELVLNGDFESGTADYWAPSVTGTVNVYESYGSLTPNSGKYFLVHEGRYGSGDAPTQFVQDQLKANGQGVYRYSSYVRLTDDAPIDSVGVRIILMTTHNEGNSWFTEDEFTTINKTEWTLVQSEREITWPGELTRCDLYFQTDQEDAQATVTSLAIDDASLVKVVAEESQAGAEDSHTDDNSSPETAEEHIPSPATGDLSVIPYILTAGIAMVGTKIARRKD